MFVDSLSQRARRQSRAKSVSLVVNACFCVVLCCCNSKVPKFFALSGMISSSRSFTRVKKLDELVPSRGSKLSFDYMKAFLSGLETRIQFETGYGIPPQFVFVLYGCQSWR